MAGVTEDVEAITGRKPMTFAEFALATAGAWRTRANNGGIGVRA